MLPCILLYVLLTILCSLSAASAAATTTCIPDQTVDTQAYTSPDGVTFTVTTSTCKPDSQVETRDVTRVIHDPFGAAIVERDASECTDPAICFCGDTCEHLISHLPPL